MWGLTRLFKPDYRTDLLGLKTIRVNGHKFRIKKINPFLDFEADKIPQIFTYFQKARKGAPDPAHITPEMIRRNIEDMKATVKAAVVWPELGPTILTVDDIFRWGDTGAKLYLAIVAHSLNQFRGLKGVFFSIRIRLWLSTQWRKNTVALQST